MIVTSHVESFADNLTELKPLFVPHHAELALYQDKMPLDPKYPVYIEAEQMGRLMHVVLREAGKIVAYFLGFIDTSLHYQQTLSLQMDIFWLHPDYRDGDSLTEVEAEVVSDKLFTAVRDEAKRRGVKVWYVGSKFHKNAGQLFERLGMTPVDVYYSQWLGD